MMTRGMRMRRMAIGAAVVLAAGGLRAAEPDWVAAMREIHAGFQGTAGYVAQFGDSITYSMAFWKPFGWSDPDVYLPDDGLPKRPVERRWRDTILGAGNEGKEAIAGNYSGWTAADLVAAVPGVLERNKPEAAIIMIGTNDSGDNTLRPTYAEELAKIVQLCLDAHCIPILSTIPPRRGCPDSVSGANKAIVELAAAKKLPLVDYHAAILERAPDGKWDGTLVSEDGRHPSGGENNVFTPENLAKCGFALRNYVTFLKYREVYFKVLHPESVNAQ
jgi:lysophospholipase L1-like esterase